MKFPDTFDFIKERNSSEQALKVLDEASELRQAAKENPSGEHALEEAMDVLQALANYLTGCFDGEDVAKAYEQVFVKNFERGYYDGHKIENRNLYAEAESHYKMISDALGVADAI